MKHDTTACAWVMSAGSSSITSAKNLLQVGLTNILPADLRERVAREVAHSVAVEYFPRFNALQREIPANALSWHSRPQPMKEVMPS